MILGNVHVHTCVHIGGTRLRPLGFDRHSVTENWEGFIGGRLFLRDRAKAGHHGRNIESKYFLKWTSCGKAMYSRKAAVNNGLAA